MGDTGTGSELGQNLGWPSETLPTLQVVAFPDTLRKGVIPDAVMLASKHEKMIVYSPPRGPGGDDERCDMATGGRNHDHRRD